jgi:hypothetical protein
VATLVTDNFDRANATDLGPNWTLVESVGDEFEINSNRAQVRSGREGYAQYTGGAPSFIDDQFCQAKLNNYSSLPWSGLGVRIRSGGAGTRITGYVFSYQQSGGNIRLARYTAQFFNSSPAQLIDSSTYTWNADDVWRIEVVGNDFICYINDVQVLSGTDSAHPTGGAPSLNSNVNGSGFHWFDDFSAGDWVPPSGGKLGDFQSGGFNADWNRNIGHP